MARISFSALVEEIVGKLAGSVFQDSYGGFQIRTRVTPRNPQTTYQQLRRGEFGFLSATWRTLTSIERQTFIDNAASPGAALNLYLQANVNLTLIEEPVITTYVPSADPGTMQLEFIEASPSIMEVIATGSPLVVPAGTKLLVQVTTDKPQTRIFTNPSMYSPIISFDEGTDLSTAVDILAEWQARYGQLRPDKYMCLKTSLIDKSNGRRGADLLNCTNTIEMAKFVKIFTAVNTVTQSTDGSQDAYTFNLPANTLAQNGDTLKIYWAIETTGGGGTKTAAVIIDGNTMGSQAFTGIKNTWFLVTVVRRSVSECVASSTNFEPSSNLASEQNTITGLNFAAAMDITFNIGRATAGTISALAAYVNKELI